MGEVPGIPTRAEGRVLGRGAHREFIEIGLSEEENPLSPEPGHDRRIIGGNKVAENPGPTGRQHAFGADIILDGQGHPREGHGAPPDLQPRIDGIGLSHGRLLLQGNVGLDLRFHLVDPKLVGTHNLPGRDLAGGELLL